MYLNKLKWLIITLSLNLEYFYLINYLNILYYITFYVFLINICISLIIWYGTKLYNWQNLLKTFSLSIILKFFFLLTLAINCLIYIYIFVNYSYFLLINQLINFYNNYFVVNALTINFLKFNVQLSMDYFGLIFCILACLVGFLSFLALDSRLYWKNIKFLFMCNLLCFLIFLFISTTDILLLLLFYESLLIPSFLFVYFVSPYRRATQAALYFLIWTQLGSLLVLVAVGFIFYTVNSSSLFDVQYFIFSNFEIKFLYCLLFFGFGFKIPIWPFHHWLTKTHVEAPAGFSMFLSGFLVKSAIYGFYKLSNILGGELNTTLFSIFLIIGVIDASFKMWGQTDLKKLIAFGTVQEMNLIFLTFCWGDTNLIWGGIIFSLTHALLSSLLFYTVDCVQRRFHTRSLIEISGILLTMPNLGIIIFLNCVFYSGLPGTLKFLSELNIYNGLLECAPLSLLILLLGSNWLGLLGFSKCWFNALYGMTVSTQKYLTIDLTLKEFLLIGFCYFGLIFFTYLNSFFFNFF